MTRPARKTIGIVGLDFDRDGTTVSAGIFKKMKKKKNWKTKLGYGGNFVSGIDDGKTVSTREH